MAAAEIRAAWHRTAATCYLLHEETKRSQKIANPELQQGVKQDSDHYCLFRSNDGWSTINSQYFLEKKLEFHFQSSDIEVKPGKLSQLSTDSGSEWETVIAPSEERAAASINVQVENKDSDRVDPVQDTTGSSSLPQQEPLNSRKLESVSQPVTRSTSAWRNADKGELAALIAKRSSEHMGNCDLPSNRRLQGSTETSRSRKEELVHLPGENKVLASMQGEQPKRVHSQPLDFSKTGTSQDSVAPTSEEQEQRAAAELPHWTGLIPEGKAELLGEALCRSQTRAREAEQRAAAAITERDQLLKLFFREASISLTYKHWVKYLQAENQWLRLRNDSDTEQQEQRQEQEEKPQQLVHPVVALQQLSNTKLRACRKASQEMMKRRKKSERSVAVLSCTVGLAFALGVGLAGAGLLFGCTMGWILIAF